ncbi:MAG TPA: hypothetical protein VFE22_03430 [Edaphobacter sp.]|nr:hypothetical protein [Edaphobacter sp.]
MSSLDTPAAKIAAPAEEPPERELQPRLDEFYEHMLDVIRAVGRGPERSPGSFGSGEEEVLRDQMLVTLNTHYRGATYAEAFNREGKTGLRASSASTQSASSRLRSGCWMRNSKASSRRWASA